MDWSTIVTIVLGSSFLGVALNNFVGWWRKRAEETNQATYLALNLAHLLEQYTYDCLSAANDHDMAERFGEEMGSYIQKVPELSQLPDGNYRVFDLELLDKIFDFQKQVCFANESLAFAFDALDGEDAIAEGYKSCLKLAQESLQIADSIRRHYRLKNRPLKFGGYSVRQHLREKLEQVYM